MKVMRVHLVYLDHEPKFMVMGKKIFTSLLIIIAVCAVGYWYIFIKKQPNNTMLNICMMNNQLEVQTEQSAKYISVDTAISKDTVILQVYTTSVLNPFAEKTSHKFITLDTAIKYLDFNNNIVLLSMFKKRQYY